MAFSILSSSSFGPFGRYRIKECRTRFGAVVFIVTDAERIDDLGLATVIRQSDTKEEALRGLEN